MGSDGNDNSENTLISPVDNVCNELRAQILKVCNDVLDFKNKMSKNEDDGAAYPELPEMLANCMLAYRHLEDARMRMGKVLQANNGGKSIFDK